MTPAFVHNALWHLAFNMYWLLVTWKPSRTLIGSLAFLVFIIVAAFVSSSFQLAISDSTGIGASGVRLCNVRIHVANLVSLSSFQLEVLDPSTIRLFVIWLPGCVVATWLKVWEVGNAAHIAGLMFGGAVAGK